MTLESILYLLFGFLIAVFLALILVPAVWNRAVYLTERKVKNSLPYNTRELEAEKDTLRAEHAMTVRRLEMAIGELREKASVYIAELHGKRDENNQLKSKSSEANESLSGLENASEKMREKIADLHEKNTELSEELEAKILKFEKLKTEHDKLLAKHSDASEELSRAKIDLIAKTGKIDSLATTLDTVNLAEDDKLSRVKDFKDEIGSLKEQLQEEKEQFRQLQESSHALEKQLNEASNEIEIADKESSEELAATRKELETRILELGEELMQERTRSIELEAELARRALNLELGNTQPEKNQTKNGNSPHDELRSENEATIADINALAKKKPTAAQKEQLRARIRALGEKAASLASP